MTNAEIAARLRDVAAALRMRNGDRFQVQAYDRAARGVEAHPEPVRALWERGRLREIRGVGGSIGGHIDEWFRTGHVRSWDELFASIPDVVLDLLRVPGVGPVTAWKLARAGVEDLEDLDRRLAAGTLTAAGIRPAQVDQIAAGLAELNRRPDRMLLPLAEALAVTLATAVRALPGVTRVEIAGSIRRRCATAGDLNLAVAAGEPGAVLDRLAALPSVAGCERPAPAAAALTLTGGQRAGVRVATPQQYGALVAWFTGSVAHTDRLVRAAGARGLRLDATGLYEGDRPLPAPDEASVYEHLGLTMPPPELREDRGELDGPLPALLTLDQLRGDCHTHTRWSDGRDAMADMLATVRARGHDYVAVTDHSYPNLDYARRAEELTGLRRRFPGLMVVNGLEVNITVEGGLQIPDEVLAAHQFCLASIHTGFRQPPDVVTARLLAALAHPSINGIAHPTGRLLLRREGVEADWDAVFDACLRHDKFLEIDGPPDRLDLPDDLVREAVRRGVKLVVDSDAHSTDDLDLQRFGIDVARRGWAGAANVINTLPWPAFAREAHVRHTDG